MIILAKATISQLPEIMGTVMAFDWGAKRVGYATSDSHGIVITPRGHFKRKASPAKNWKLSPGDIANLLELKKNFDVEHWVLGLPLNIEGYESDASRLCVDLAQELEKHLGGDITLVDESLTSWDQKNSTDVDAGAAATILSDFFEQKKRMALQRGSARFTTIVFLGLLLLVLGSFGSAYYQFAFKSAGEVSIDTAPTVIVDVKPGSSFSSVRADLENNMGFEIPSLAFKVWSRLNLGGKKLRVGEYRIQKSWSARKIFNELVSGSPLLYKVVVKEGYNRWDILTAFADSRGGQDPAVLEKHIMDTSLLAGIEFLKTQTARPTSLEGFLFPETYAYQKYDSPKKLVEAMIGQFEKRAIPILEQHPWSKQPGGMYRLLVLASIVEKESGVKEEQPLIASVFWNRLAKRMKLQSDPTTIYGLLPNFDGNITRAHLLTPTAWNTYTLPELPVTPIANPGETALRAVVQPAESDYLFFVSRNDGTHLFSADYKTHNSYVEEYQRKRKGARVQSQTATPPRSTN